MFREIRNQCIKFISWRFASNAIKSLATAAENSQKYFFPCFVNYQKYPSRCSNKKLKNSSKFTRKHVLRSLSSCDFWKKFSEHLFYRTPPSDFIWISYVKTYKFVFGPVFNNVKRHICANSNNLWKWILFNYVFSYVVGLGK